MELSTFGKLFGCVGGQLNEWNQIKLDVLVAAPGVLQIEAK